MNRPITYWSGAHSCGDAHHNCTFVRLSARTREDVQGVGTSIHILEGHKRRAMQQSPCSRTTAPNLLICRRYPLLLVECLLHATMISWHFPVWKQIPPLRRLSRYPQIIRSHSSTL